MKYLMTCCNIITQLCSQSTNISPLLYSQKDMRPYTFKDNPNALDKRKSIIDILELLKININIEKEDLSNIQLNLIACIKILEAEIIKQGLSVIVTVYHYCHFLEKFLLKSLQYLGSLNNKNAHQEEYLLKFIAKLFLWYGWFLENAKFPELKNLREQESVETIEELFNKFSKSKYTNLSNEMAQKKSNESQIAQILHQLFRLKLDRHKLKEEEGLKQNKLKTDQLTLKLSGLRPQGSNDTQLQIDLLLLDLFYLKSQAQNNSKSIHERRIEINIFIEEKLLIEEPTSFYQQIAINWISIQAEKIQNQASGYLCCKIIYENNSSVGAQEDEKQEFKKYHWPLENANIIYHVRKTVVAFLNTKGGIMYMGLFENKEKEVNIVGMGLTQQNKIEFLKFIYKEVMEHIYPVIYKQNQADLKKIDKSEFQKRIKLSKKQNKSNSYEINRYASVDFMTVYDKDTLLSSYDKQKQIPLYIVRLKIKLGYSNILYHLVNEKNQLIEAYLREDKNVKKKNMEEFYKLFYEKIKSTKDYAMEGREFHLCCRFNRLIEKKTNK